MVFPARHSLAIKELKGEEEEREGEEREGEERGEDLKTKKSVNINPNT